MPEPTTCSDCAACQARLDEALKAIARLLEATHTHHPTEAFNVHAVYTAAIEEAEAILRRIAPRATPRP